MAAREEPEIERRTRPLHVYIPVDLYARASAKAKEDRRTLTAWVELTLQAALDLAEEYGPLRAGKRRR